MSGKVSTNLPKIARESRSFVFLVVVLLLIANVILGAVIMYTWKTAKYPFYVAGFTKEIKEMSMDDVYVENLANIAFDVAFFGCNYTPGNFLSRHEFIMNYYVAPEKRAVFRDKVLLSEKVVQDNKLSSYFMPSEFLFDKNNKKITIIGKQFLYNEKVTLVKDVGVEVYFSRRDKYGMMIDDYKINYNAGGN